MFILLNDKNRDNNKEIVVNTELVRYMNPGMTGGTVITFSDECWFVVEESISDIFARMRKE